MAAKDLPKSQTFMMRYGWFYMRYKGNFYHWNQVMLYQMTASERRSFGVPARPYPRNGHVVGDADIEPI